MACLTLHERAVLSCDLGTLRPFCAGGIVSVLTRLSSSQKRVGALNLLQLLEGLEGLTLALFTRALGWSTEAIHVYLAAVRKDAMKKSVHMIHDL